MKQYELRFFLLIKQDLSINLMKLLFIHRRFQANHLHYLQYDSSLLANYLYSDLTIESISFSSLPVSHLEFAFLALCIILEMFAICC